MAGPELHELEGELERAYGELEAAREELAEFQCPTCGAAVSERLSCPADPEEKHWDIRETFECGYTHFGGELERPCPKDPNFPSFEDYDLQFGESQTERYWKWKCQAIGKTKMARCLWLPLGYGRTKEESEKAVRDSYERCRRVGTARPHAD